MIARAGALCLALAAGLGGTALADRLPALPPARGSAAPAASVRLDIPAATPALVCPGPETEVVPDGATPVPAPGPFTVTAVASGSGNGAALGGLAAPGRSTPLAGTGDVRVLARPGPPGGPLRLSAASTADTPDGAGSRLAAVQVTIARSGDLRGLAAASCAPAAADAWLVGGATAPGRRARLLLANPTPAAAVVDVRLSGPAGPVDVPSLRGLVVAPGRVRAVLRGAAAVQARSAVTVRSGPSGGPATVSDAAATTGASESSTIAYAPGRSQRSDTSATPPAGTVTTPAPGDGASPAGPTTR